MRLSFSKADVILLSALSCEVRLLSTNQSARLIDCDHQEAMQIIDRLASGEYLTRQTQVVSVDATPIAPIYAWDFSKQLPNYRSASYQLRKRWQHPTEQQLLFATDKARKIFGGTRVRPRSEGEVNHDLWVSEVYLRYLSSGKLGEDTSWVSGDTLRYRGEAGRYRGFVPDACLVKSDRSIRLIIEVGGKGYATSKLARLHERYSSLSSYELW